MNSIAPLCGRKMGDGGGETSRSVRAEFAHLFELENGRIVRFVQYIDMLKVTEAMGLIQMGEI
jgi:ketosteroid isomerase-like protein